MRTPIAWPQLRGARRPSKYLGLFPGEIKATRGRREPARTCSSNVHGFARKSALRALHDLLEPPLGCFQLLLAVRLEALPALIKGNRILEVHFALLEP